MQTDPKYNKRPEDPNFMDSKHTPMTEEMCAYYFREAWKNIYNEYPKDKSLGILWCQSRGETGSWKFLRCYNWGNIKRRVKDPNLGWTAYEAGEYVWENGKSVHKMFYPYHPQTHFAAWKDPLEAAEYYIRFLSQRDRYEEAWKMVIAGDVVGYCRELKEAGYFTDTLDHYTSGMVWLMKQFEKKKDKLMSWTPPEPEPTNKHIGSTIESFYEELDEPLPEIEPEKEKVVETSLAPAPKQNIFAIIWAMILSFLGRFNGRK